ncbi:unnamed protein product, partial [Brassica oleracea]
FSLSTLSRNKQTNQNQICSSPTSRWRVNARTGVRGALLLPSPVFFPLLLHGLPQSLCFDRWLRLEACRITSSLQRRSVSGDVQVGDGASAGVGWWFLLTKSSFRVRQGSFKPLEGRWRVEASD